MGLAVRLVDQDQFRRRRPRRAHDRRVVRRPGQRRAARPAGLRAAEHRRMGPGALPGDRRRRRSRRPADRRMGQQPAGPAGIHIGGHYYNVADFFIIGCTPLFLLAAGYQGVREARRPVAARSVPPPARSPARARVRVSALAGAGLILVVALGAVNYGGVNAAPPHAGAQRDGHACSNRGRAAPRLLAGIQAPRHAPSQRAQGWPGPATPRTKCPFRPGLQFRVRLYVCGFPCHSTGNHKHMRSSSPSLVAQNATSGDIRGKTAWFARHAETSTKNQTRPWTH